MTTDYHDFSHRGTLRATRDSLGIGDLYVNGAICGECGWFVRSRNRHDMVTCKCGNVSVDGGSMYAKRNFKTGNYTDVIEYYSDVEERLNDRHTRNY